MCVVVACVLCVLGEYVVRVVLWGPALLKVPACRFALCTIPRLRDHYGPRAINSGKGEGGGSGVGILGSAGPVRIGEFWESTVAAA